MDFVEHSCSRETKSLSGTQCMNQTGLNADNISHDFSEKGLACKMGMTKLSVKDYMSSLHSYMEAPPTAKWDGGEKPATSAPTSISEMLKLCEADPVELLIDLGFGIDEPDICTKIPSRFIMTPSEAKGINTRVFLEAQKRRMEIESPNLCGRFRQLEVLDQVTTAFSSLLKDVHKVEEKNVKKSTLSPEKRKQIRQLLWKFSRQMKIADENLSPCMVSDGPTEKQDHCEPLKDTANVNDFSKRSHSTDKENAEDLSKEQLPNTDNENVSPLRPEALSALSSPVKPYNLSEMAGKIRTLRGPKVLSKTFRKAFVQNRLQPPDSFELEEVQSFEEDFPRTLSQDRISEITRTNSCQSDSSGFQEDPPEPFPLKNLHGSSESLDSQVTLHGKSSSSEFPDISEEYDDVQDFTDPLVTENATVTSASHSLPTGKHMYKSLSMTTENSDDFFQSFESHADNMKEMYKQISILEDTENELEEITNGSRDDDMDNMKKACQTYREKLLTIEQHLLEQQAGCFNVLTSEEREKIRRLHLLRRDVLKEATELEFNLDERARHVKEAISVQLEQVLEEQSRLYSELEFSDLELERSAEGHSKNLYKSQSVPSTSDLSDPEEDPEIKTNSEAGIQSQKIDFSTILENIKKTFRSFNN